MEAVKTAKQQPPSIQVLFQQQPSIQVLFHQGCIAATGGKLLKPETGGGGDGGGKGGGSCAGMAPDSPDSDGDISKYKDVVNQHTEKSLLRVQFVSFFGLLKVYKTMKNLGIANTNISELLENSSLNVYLPLLSNLSPYEAADKIISFLNNPEGNPVLCEIFGKLTNGENLFKKPPRMMEKLESPAYKGCEFSNDALRYTAFVSPEFFNHDVCLENINSLLKGLIGDGHTIVSIENAVYGGYGDFRINLIISGVPVEIKFLTHEMNTASGKEHLLYQEIRQKCGPRLREIRNAFAQFAKSKNLDPLVEDDNNSLRNSLPEIGGLSSEELTTIWNLWLDSFKPYMTVSPISVNVNSLDRDVLDSIYLNACNHAKHCEAARSFHSSMVKYRLETLRNMLEKLVTAI